MRILKGQHFSVIKRLVRDNRGSSLIIFGFSITLLVFTAGMSIDYTRAVRLQTKLNAAADAAALAGVTLPMMDQTDAAAKTAATNMFNSQASGLNGLIYDPQNLVVTVTSTSGASISRTVNVSYTALSENAFAGILGRSTLDIGGSSEAYASNAPNIDFYIMVDTSPSMALPATSAGLQAMIAATPTQGGGKGCAFACHQTNTSKTDPGGTEIVNGQYVDNYYIAKTKLKLTLRSDLTSIAVKDLADVAVSTSAANKAKYRMALSTFDWTYRDILKSPTSDMDAFKTQTANIQLLQVCANNQRVCGKGDQDMHTNFNGGANVTDSNGAKSTGALAGASANLPAASGGGTNQPSDTPQAMLFIVTDGMRDENDSGTRRLGPMTTTQCAAIKARNIRIAVLYTEYLPESASDNWSITNVKTPYLTSPEKISPALIACATPGLFYKVTTDGDISSALAALFQKAVSTARLTK